MEFDSTAQLTLSLFQVAIKQSCIPWDLKFLVGGGNLKESPLTVTSSTLSSLPTPNGAEALVRMGDFFLFLRLPSSQDKVRV